jgi:hypothetical protein
MWLTVCPAESEHPGTEIKYFQKATMNTKTAFRKQALVKL